MQTVNQDTHRKKILVVSPTTTHPQNAGNRARIYNLLMNLKGLGYEIHFVYCGREYASEHVKSRLDFNGMFKSWDMVFYPSCFSFSLPKWNFKNHFPSITGNLWKLKKPFYPIIGNLWRFRNLYLRSISQAGKILKKTSPFLYKRLKPLFPDKRPKDMDDCQISAKSDKTVKGKLQPEAITEIDKWYNFNVDKLVRTLHQKYKYDAVIAEYVFTSRVLTNFGDDVIKIIDTHDIFTDRNKKYEQKGLSDTFFTTTAEEEAKGLNRADKIIAIQDEEKRFFEKLTDKEVITIGHTVNLLEPTSKQETNKNILYLATANIANIHGINWFIKEAMPLIRNKIPEAKLILAGHICKHVEPCEGIIKLGEVENINDAYSRADIVINPGIVGTGLKIKNIEALGRGKILITSSHSAEGLKYAKNPFITANTAEEFANAIVNVMSNLDIYNSFACEAYKFAKEYNENNIKPLKLLFNNEELPVIPKFIINNKLSKKSDSLLRMGFCHHKCGTSYLRRIFNGICNNINFDFSVIKNLSDDILINIKNEKIIDLHTINPKNTFLFFENGHYENQILKSNLKNFKAFHIIRDPRDVIVSGYFSHKYSHPIDGSWGQQYLLPYRKWLNSVPEEEGLLKEIKNGYALHQIAKWNFNDPNIFEIKFEDLIANPFAVFAQVFEFLQIQIDPIILKSIIEKHSFENMTKGRKPGEENQMHHFRKGIPGDWKNHFNKEHVELFKKKWGGLIIRLGYEKDNNWGDDIN